MSDDLLDGQFLELAGALQHHPDPGPPRGGRPGRVDPEHADLAGVALPEPFEDFDRGGLPRAVRPQKGEDLAGEDRQVEAVDGGESGAETAPVRLTGGRRRFICFSQILHMYCGINEHVRHYA
ncbi:hypothetical protein Lfu02_52630 [Longispora fulva]|nr:hypothetical protein Lfu02_52630 [Longispora fulva]